MPTRLSSDSACCCGGFANTDLDQQLKVHRIQRLIIIGLIANTCLEATARFAAELGYDVTVVKDATAGFSEEEMHAALDINLPNYANAIVTTTEILEAIYASPASSLTGGVEHGGTPLLTNACWSHVPRACPSFLAGLSSGR